MAEDKSWWDEIEGMMNRAVDAVEDAWESSEEGRHRAMAAVNSLLDELKGVAAEATSAAKRSWSERAATDTERGDQPDEPAGG
jgi:hypothetical protein